MIYLVSVMKRPELRQVLNSYSMWSHRWVVRSVTKSHGNKERTRVPAQRLSRKQKRKTKLFMFYYYWFSRRLSSLTINTPPTLSSRESPDAVGLSLGVCQISGFLPSLRRLACRTMGLNCFSRIDDRTSSWLSPFSDDVMSAASKPCQPLVKHVSMLPQTRYADIELLQSLFEVHICQQLVKHVSMRLKYFSSSASIPLESMLGHTVVSVLFSRHGFRWLVWGHIYR